MSNADRTRSAPRSIEDRAATRHPLLDRGASAVLVLVLGLFVAPAAAWIRWGRPIEPSRSIETTALVWCALLALLLPLVQITMHIRLVGGELIRGNRDTFPTLTGMPARVVRAHANLIESLVPFAITVLAAQATSANNRTTAAAAVGYLVARVVHALTYTLGITVIRSAAFYAGLIATVAIASQVLRL